ncbi:hypothetical protein [Streptomyces himalayensis]|uniref:Uncharacterized protein n=1 Tax=Streptomyces himalayensis subsp. himalayensis TaxID=2756131 RepID=A0A7W0DVU4_9ACTN|nr:hypothetical protein [Streptomyces himalayensis]MBA2951870.1 hypothetical protein [Streptomyces himalayensis subsp. himalayensis]
MAKASAVKSRSQAFNQLKAVLVASDAALREALTGRSNPKLSELEIVLARLRWDTRTRTRAYVERRIAEGETRREAIRFPGGEALENQWSSAAVRHYRAAEPSRLVKDMPLYTL